jgi:hypothetical protein
MDGTFLGLWWTNIIWIKFLSKMASRYKYFDFKIVWLEKMINVASSYSSGLRCSVTAVKSCILALTLVGYICNRLDVNDTLIKFLTNQLTWTICGLLRIYCSCIQVSCLQIIITYNKLNCRFPDSNVSCWRQLWLS